jgi:hypothetical protein
MTDPEKFKYILYVYEISSKYLSPDDKTLMSLRDATYVSRYKHSNFNFADLATKLNNILPVDVHIKTIEQFLRDDKISSLLQ